MWLAAQVYLLCLVSFLAGAGIAVLALRNRVPAPAATEPESTLDDTGDLAEDETDDPARDERTERVKEPSA